MKYTTRVIDKLLHCLLSCVVVLCSFVYFMIYSTLYERRYEMWDWNKFENLFANVTLWVCCTVLKLFLGLRSTNVSTYILFSSPYAILYVRTKASITRVSMHKFPQNAWLIQKLRSYILVLLISNYKLILIFIFWLIRRSTMIEWKWINLKLHDN